MNGLDKLEQTLNRAGHKMPKVDRVEAVSIATAIFVCGIDLANGTDSGGDTIDIDHEEVKSKLLK